MCFFVLFVNYGIYTCDQSWVNDGICDSSCSFEPDCNYDGADCVWVEIVLF